MTSRLINIDVIGSATLTLDGEYVLVTRTGTLRNNDNVITSGAVGSGFIATSIINNGEIISGTTGSFFGPAAIEVTSGVVDILNSGFLITTDGRAIGSEGSGFVRLTNQGTIFGVIDFNGVEVTNEVTNTGLITGAVWGAALNRLELWNGGTINRTFQAVVGGGRDDVVTNAGRILGDVQLMGGHDRYDGTLGQQPDGVFGGFGDDTLLGGFAGEKLYGDEGDDPIEGGGGNDTLAGDAGQDELYGGRRQRPILRR